MRAIGEYDLEITEQDWHAEEKSSEVYEGGDANGGLFHKPLMLKTFHTRERRRVPDRKALEADRKKQFGTNDIMEMREKIRAVMCFSGPRMIFSHLVMAVRYVIEQKREQRRLKKE